MLEQKNSNAAKAFFIASLASVVASIGVWMTVDGDPAHAERFGIFVGLWAPTLMGLSNYFREQIMNDKVYYDESCYVCSLEINAVRKRGEACGIEFVDISDPSFNKQGDFESEMVGEFDGMPTTGADTFRLMYEKMGFKKTIAFTRLPVFKQLFDSGYWIFAHCIRPYLPRKKRV